MAHIEDRWHKTVVGADGKPKRFRTELYGKGLRYRVRYIAPNGKERSKSFPDRAKRDAEAFMVSVESDKLRQSYVDPGAGRILFAHYAETWLRGSRVDPSTRETVESRLRNHLLPYFGPRQLGQIKPEHVREWDTEMSSRYAVKTRQVSFAVLRAILNAAIDDERIVKNPCVAKSVVPPRAEQRKVVPWELARVSAVRAALGERYSTMVDVAAGCGGRQGEVIGLAVDDVDFAGGWLHIRRQVKRVRSRLVFGSPKNDKERRVPLPTSVAEALRAHMARCAPVMVTLPWEDPSSEKLVSVRLIFTTARGTAIHRCNFDQKHWQRALRLVGVPKSRENGFHALRHFYASALLDAGESIKAVSEYLGHSNPGFTLRVYTHLMAGSDDRTRTAIDGLLGDVNVRRPEDGLDGLDEDKAAGEDG